PGAGPPRRAAAPPERPATPPAAATPADLEVRRACLLPANWAQQRSPSWELPRLPQNTPLRRRHCPYGGMARSVVTLAYSPGAPSPTSCAEPDPRLERHRFWWPTRKEIGHGSHTRSRLHGGDAAQGARDDAEPHDRGHRPRDTSA